MEATEMIVLKNGCLGQQMTLSEPFVLKYLVESIKIEIKKWGANKK
jgi:hypothetical protein